MLSGTGTINLGSGNLTTNDLLSGISGGSLSVANQYVGSGGTGTFTQSGGNNSIGNTLYLGYNAGDSGAYNLSGSGQLSASGEYVGYSGTGTFTQTGGTNSLGYGGLYLGANAGSSGAYNLSGSGQLSSPNYEYVGSSGTGTFTQSGGTNNCGSYLYLGNNTGSSGTYNLSGSGQLSASYYEYVGMSGAGTFTQTRRDQQHLLSLSWLQRRQQRRLQPQRQRPAVGALLRVRRLVRHGDLHAERRDQ